ncbi:chemotaxis protein CheW [Calorimonas adulescens]|jgi:CheW-like domain.|uniref:Chemotaxis protein CheW n=1 Tax=Calorimonas adulescens TaxID=2606906 RepID=A0A5D8QHA9_9THEO|nr:chemotaxis protein CheW [Calorimonas adulescens]TZE83584.1 purine-binding chemotaxis protein CheW [Calorimonas adulescens]
MSERQVVVFKLQGEEYCIDIMKVMEIIRMQEIVKLPDTPDFVEGVVNLRGKIIPVIDLKKRFHLEGKEISEETRIIITDTDGKTVGFIVDNVTEVLRLNEDDIEPINTDVVGIDKDYIAGIGKLENRLLILLDLNKVLTKEEKSILKEEE